LPHRGVGSALDQAQLLQALEPPEHVVLPEVVTERLADGSRGAGCRLCPQENVQNVEVELREL